MVLSKPDVWCQIAIGRELKKMMNDVKSACTINDARFILSMVLIAV